MQNQDEGPRYTDPGHPYSGSDGRYQNQYSTRSRRPADKPFQFPWWAIVIPFCIGMWPVGIAFIIMNKLMKEGKMADLEERARQRTSQFTHTSRTTTGSDGRTVYEAQFRRVDESGTSTSRNADANTPIYGRSVPPQSTVEATEKQGKKTGAATALTVAGVALLICALIALPDGIFWLPDALAEGGYYWRWLIEDSMPMLIAAAGGLVGLADNETAVTNSYSVSTLAADGVGSEYFVFGDVVGASYNQGLNGIDDRICLVYNAFNAEDKTVVQGGRTYDLTVWADVSELFGWAQTDWTFDGGEPKVNPEGINNIDFTVTFDFSGETVTNEAPDGSMLSQQSDPVKSNVYIPVYWVYAGSGMNNFSADSGKISFGYFLDEDCTNRIPSAMMITRDMTVYVGFADYSAIGGTYYTTVHPEVADLTDTDVKLVFDDNGKMTMYFQAKSSTTCTFTTAKKYLSKALISESSDTACWTDTTWWVITMRYSTRQRVRSSFTTIRSSPNKTRFSPT